jgi:hypothetical protein
MFPLCGARDVMASQRKILSDDGDVAQKLWRGFQVPVGDDTMTALIALLNVPAENGRSTVFDGVEDSEMDQVQQSAAGSYNLLSVLTDDIGHLVGRPVHPGSV